MKIIEPFNDLRLGKGAYNCPAGVSEINDYAGDGFALCLVQTLKNTVVMQPFENFSPSRVRALVPVVEKADNSFILLALIPAQPERLVKKMFDYLI